MRSPQEAIADILGRVRAIDEVESVSLDAAAGRVLAGEVRSDVDLPPFEKSAMDGFAVRRADFGNAAEATLTVVGESRAGGPFDGSVRPGECVEIYTGAELPSACDAVVMVEHSSRDGDRVTLAGAPGEHQNVCRTGEDLRRDEPVFAVGRRLSSIDLSVLAAVGCDPVPVFRRPRACVLTTGDELVPAADQPARGQIREGNTYHLAAMARACGAEALNLGIVRDSRAVLAERFRAALDSSDVVITTGGVSMGRYDLVGATFAELGVEPVFHKVAIKPGKPIWFGMAGATAVFALPGNPVSCLVCHEVFVRPALLRMGGAADAELAPRIRRGRWRGAATRTNARQQNLPVRVVQGSDGIDELLPLDWKSSADIVGLARADGLLIVEPDAVVEPGELALFRTLGRSVPARLA